MTRVSNKRNVAHHKCRRLTQPRYAGSSTSRTSSGMICTRSPEEHPGWRGGTAASQRAHALRAVRQFVWLEAGSVKAALSRPGRAPGWCPIPPRRIEPVEITSTPEGAYPYRVLRKRKPFAIRSQNEVGFMLHLR